MQYRTKTGLAAAVTLTISLLIPTAAATAPETAAQLPTEASTRPSNAQPSPTLAERPDLAGKPLRAVRADEADRLKAAKDNLPKVDALRATVAKLGGTTSLDVTSVAEYARTEGVSTEEAERRLLLEEQAAVTMNWLAENRPHSYTEFRLERNPYHFEYRSTDPVDKALAGAPLGDIGDLITVHEVKHSGVWLQRRTEALAKGVRARGVKVDAGIDLGAQRIELSVEAKDMSKVRSVVEADPVMTSSATVDVTDTGGSTPAVRVHGGLNFDSRDGDCTTGFAAVRRDGVRVLWISAHCPNRGTVVHGSGSPTYVNDVEHYFQGQDVQQMFATVCCIQVPNWVNDAQNPAGDPTPWYRRITNYQLSNVNMINRRVEKYGRNTGYNSGLIERTNFSPSYVPRVTATFYTVALLARCGDSGGPVMIGEVAYGVLSGSTNRDSCLATTRDRMIYMPVRNSTLPSTIAVN